MLSKRKWALALLFVSVFFIVAYLEDNNTLSTNYTTTLLEPQKPAEMYKKVRAWVDQSDKKIKVSAPVANPPLIQYESIQPFGDGAILAVEQSQDLYASENGLIIFTGYKKDTSKTMSILYDTGETASFGFVAEFHQLPYTTVSPGDIFATVENELLYIEVVKDGKKLEMSELVDWLAATYE
ncbi:MULTISPECIES: hypothetical protein [unclassified Psychrobacillus]|uniref:hypothetical protein n=1 Tax=unclassified Psychrobacillus TaxID=2636677 RepID=UPI002497C0FA|nr:hypothetical protein [Psychrobacillus sp. NEAU-3TGS]MDI2588238.1 hypothetical protein [Psychrobacillus sp. NEAU-3TGS]